MKLYIDSTDYEKVVYSLVNTDKILKETFRVVPHESHHMLANLEIFLKQNKVLAGHIEGILVCSGPGSYTGIRVGIAHAQAIGLALNVPVRVVPREKWRVK